MQHLLLQLRRLTLLRIILNEFLITLSLMSSATSPGQVTPLKVVSLLWSGSHCGCGAPLEARGSSSAS